ncbi:MAG: ABC transporter permease [Clostridium sp.]
MLENIRLSFQGIWSHKMRSFLTMLGIIIGIASIITIVSTIKGTNEQIKRNLIGAGSNTVDIQLFQEEWQYEMDYNGVPEGVPVISPEVFETIKNLENVEAASIYNMRRSYDTVFFGNTSLSGGQIMGIDNNYFNTCGYRIKKGRGLTGDDFTKYRKVAILDQTSVDSLFAGVNPVGETIEISGEAYTVIGVAELSQKFEPVINSMEDYYMYAQNSSGMVFIPDSTWPIIYGYDEPQSVVVRAKTTDDMATVGKAVADTLNGYVTNPNNIKYKAENILQQAKELQELSAATNNQLIWIASISLLVGGIGVMNIMLVSVTERTKEIGLKKAIGAPNSKILTQFLTEAAVLTSLGGVLGVLVGIALAQVVSKMSQAPVAISVPAIMISVVFSMVIGIVFGLLPSVKAAKLKPIDALRYE